MSDRKRLITDLRVIDLRAELEKRNLDKSGVRGVLIQRLSKYLKDEGHDPATFSFDLSNTDKKSSPNNKKTRRTESAVEPESEEIPAMEDMIVIQEVCDEEEPAQEADESTTQATAESASASADNSMDVDTAETIKRKREPEHDSDAPEPKKSCLADKEEDHKTETNTDAEDSINLDIGDDELLNDEPDTTSKHDNKDDDAVKDEANKPAREETAADNTATASDSPPADAQQDNAEAPATSKDGDKTEQDDKHKSDSDGEKKDKKDEGKEGARNLWVSGLSRDTRAKDLKQLCLKYGKVIGAKVVTNARTPGSRCYGYVTMENAADAKICMQLLHGTILHGRKISVEKAKSESDSLSRRQRSGRRSSKDEEDGKDKDDKDNENKDKKKDDGTESNRSNSQTRDKTHRTDKEKSRRGSRSHERRRSPKDQPYSSKIFKQRLEERARVRAAREEERRRRAAQEALRERERRQRQEKHHLAIEREKLRAEREKIEREKNELLRLERERHRLEREKLELERLELKRAQLRLEEERRKRAYRKPAVSPPPVPAYERERHKRAPPPPIASSRGQFEAPPPPRFEIGSNYDRNTDKRDRDYKRDYPRHVTSNTMKYPSNGNTNEDSRQPVSAIVRPKEPSRAYDSRDNRQYRPSLPVKQEQRSWNASSRYPDASGAPKGSTGGSGETWSNSAPRYGGGGSAYEPRYPPSYQPPPPGATYPDRYAPTREYRKY